MGERSKEFRVSDSKIMRAWRVHEYGQPCDVLRLDQVPIPNPGPGEFRVRVPDPYHLHQIKLRLPVGYLQRCVPAALG